MSLAHDIYGVSKSYMVANVTIGTLTVGRNATSMSQIIYFYYFFWLYYPVNV